AALHRGTDAVAGIQELVGEALGHGLLTALPGVADEPADGEGVGAGGLDLDRHLVGGTADATALDLELRLDVLDRPLEGGDRLGAGLLLDRGQRLVDDALSGRPLPADEDLVDDAGDEDRSVDRVRHQLAPRGGTLAGHVVTTPSSCRSGCGPACGPSR